MRYVLFCVLVVQLRFEKRPAEIVLHVNQVLIVLLASGRSRISHQKKPPKRKQDFSIRLRRKRRTDPIGILFNESFPFRRALHRFQKRSQCRSFVPFDDCFWTRHDVLVLRFPYVDASSMRCEHVVIEGRFMSMPLFHDHTCRRDLTHQAMWQCIKIRRNLRRDGTTGGYPAEKFGVERSMVVHPLQCRIGKHQVVVLMVVCGPL